MSSGSGSLVELNDSEITVSGGIALTTYLGGVIISNRMTVTTSGIGVIVGSGGSMELNDSSVTVTGSSNVINVHDGGNLVINGGTMTGDSRALLTVSGTDNSNIMLNNVDTANTGGINTASNFSGASNVIINGGSGINGGVTNSGSGVLNINLDNSSLTGNGNNTGDGMLNITGSNGSTIIGNLTGSGSSNTTVTITGPNGSFLGDVDQRDDSTITVNISGGASGTGGFIDGGNLNVSPGSEFTFDKDSHGNNGINDGTWNIGDHTVIFDNMNNNGKIVIDINSDDQSHGSLDVTGSASGDGKITINVTGSTAASQEDQDRIINDLVQGNGKGVWEFEDYDWGLIEEEVVAGPDGNLYTRPNGKLSTAGSIATGLSAAQKGAWFAQQNSLLKRMGELRLQNGVESVNISGKEDKEVAAPMFSADKLIENVWIRSYGQQLNYGTSVTGQAFKQYVYGVDIGTDHKFTLDRDNNLFTGVFLGYGAADTDHRHHGSKSEISNYYAGLYASWLNDSGWYLDATLKAQYTDNELTGNAGGANHFNGSYNNWSVGGSVEFGKQIKFAHDWFIEPQLQANYLHILASDYTMSQGLNVNVS
ncbi:MAG: autotransporter outer membrane beta-barrel domain-containing protein, partial [Verrucomicrobiales bacterium]|nr:autotransporter outer membrane beta-barrel domain-containing protein [Verrucomicrobiales bacterium]